MFKEINRQNELELQEKQEEIYLKIYLAMYQKMDSKNYISYEEFKKNALEFKNNDNFETDKTDEELYKELEEICIEFNRKEGEKTNGDF